MNDNLPLDPDNLPDWAWDIVERHDLYERADCPLAATIVLLHDLAFDLEELGLTAFREQALSTKTRQAMAACAAMLSDALKLAPLCPTEPCSGVVVEAGDGTLTWAEPAAADLL